MSGNTKSPETIEFGEEMEALDYEYARIYEVFGPKDNALISTVNANTWWMDMIDGITAQLKDMVSPTISSGGATTFACGLMNLTRLARQDMDLETYIYTMSKISDELATDQYGTVVATKTVTNAFIPIAQWCCGANLKDLVGTWDNQKYVVQDQVAGGIFLVAMFILKYYNLHLISFNTILRNASQWAKDGRGAFKPFISTDTTTYGTLSFETEHDITEYDKCFLNFDEDGSLFGVSPNDLDSPLLRAMTVVKLEGIESTVARLLSPTRWNWRFGRYLEVHPLYFIGSLQDIGAAEFIHEMHDSNIVRPFVDDASDLRTFNNKVNSFVADLQKFYFRNDSYGTLKQMFKFTSFFDLPTIPEAGMGGLLAYQTSVITDGGEARDSLDNIMLGAIALHDNAINVIQPRRVFNADDRFVVIGDVPLQDYLLVAGLMTTTTLQAGGASQAEIGAGDYQLLTDGFFFFYPTTAYGFVYSKNEYEPYKLSRELICYIAAATYDSNAEETKVNFIGYDTEYPNTKWAHTPASGAIPTPVCDITKEGYFYGRALDPFKKLTWTAYDINEADGDVIRNIMREFYFGKAAPSVTIADSPIPVSAVPDKKEVPTSAIPEDPKNDDNDPSTLVKEVTA